MVYMKLDGGVELELVSPYNADEIYALVDANRDYLAEYLTWVDETKGPEEVLASTRRSLETFAAMKGVAYVIKVDGAIAGRISMWLSEERASVYEIGYWIAEAASGRGVMTRCVDELVRIGIENLNAEKFEIVCVVGNIASNRVAQKAGFRLEGTRRRSQIVRGVAYDMNRYGLLRGEYAR